ncbi:unnamed protein product [Leuciscus chuanchicus]
MDRMELKNVSTEADDESSVDDRYTEPIDSEKATINSQFLDEEDAESQKFLTNGMMKKKKYEEYHEEYHPGHASFGMSVFNLSNAIMGSGILGLSFAMANTGIVLFIILLLGVAILSLYSVHLLLVTAKEGGSLIYEKLGERAFGWPGKVAAFGSITLQNIGAMSSYLFIVKYELPEVIRAFLGLEESSGEWYLNGNYVVVFVSIGIILPLSMLKNLGYLGYTSGFSLSCMVFFLGVLIYKKTILPCPLPFFYQHGSNMSVNGSDALGLYTLQNASALAYISEASVNGPHLDPHAATYDPAHSPVEFTHQPDDHEDMCTPKYFVFNSQTAYTLPILAFAFVCHPEVLPIYSELKDRSRKKMQTVSNLSILAMLVMYLFSALFGYLTFYDHVEAELLHTFTKVYKFDTMLLMVRLAVLTAVTLTVPIVLFPIRSSVTTLCFAEKEFSWIRHFLIAAAILAFNNLLVIFVPTIRDIFGFIGSSAATMLIFILPAAFYLRLVKSIPLRSPQKISAAIFLVFGVFFMFISLTLIALDWIHNPPGSKGSHGSASFGMSVFNLGNAIMGSGILGLAYAMANTGIAMFVILLLAVAIFSLYSVHLLLKTANEGGSLVYEQLGYKAFGIPGKLAASCSITMQNFGAMASYLYIVKYELPIVIKAFLDINDNAWYTNGDYLVLIVTVSIILPLSLLKNLGYLGYTSGFSLLCMVFFVIVVIYKKFQIPCPLPEDFINITVNASQPQVNTTEEECCKPKYFVFNSQTVYAVPILTFAFVCHPAILPMYEELKDRSRRKMQNVANVSFLGMFIMYLLAALFGYLTFNEAVEPELLHTYSKVYSFDVVLLIVRFAVLTAVTLTVPVVLFPIRTSVNQLLGASKDFSWPRHIGITVALLVCVNILVIFVPTIRDIFGFIGASAAAMLIFILPSAFYIRLVEKESMRSVQKIGALLFLIMGIIVMISSMTLIILDWIHNAGSSDDHSDGH